VLIVRRLCVRNQAEECQEQKGQDNMFIGHHDVDLRLNENTDFSLLINVATEKLYKLATNQIRLYLTYG